MLFSSGYTRVHLEFLWMSAFFIFIFLLYMATSNPLVWGDTVASRYLPISIIREFNFDLNEFDLPYDEDIPYFVQYRNGRLISSYPVGASLAALPFYLIPVLLGISHQSPWIPLLEKLSASLIVVFSTLFLYLSLRQLAPVKTCLVVTATYAFCTSAFSISSQALWQHGPSQFFLALGLYFLIRGLHEEKFTFLSGLPLSTAIICRPTDVLMIIPLLIYLILHRRKFFLLWILCAMPPMIFLIIYNYYYFGSIINSGYGPDVIRPLSSYWSTPFLYGLSGILFSPSKGLFTYSPVLLFGFFGIFSIWKNKYHPLLRYLSLGPVFVLILYSKWHFWWGGETYGPRLISDITPFVCLYIYPIWRIIEKTSLIKISFIVLAVISLSMHAIGAFGFDASWYKKVGVSVEDNRLWSFRESPFVHYGLRLFLKNLSILRTGLSRLPTSPQSPHLLAASLVLQEVPSYYRAGEPIVLHVITINTGAAIWLFQTNNGQYAMRLGWRWINSEGDVLDSEGRTPIRQDIFPGEREELNIEIVPPSIAGKYSLELGMINELGAWFGASRFSVEIVGSCHFEDTMTNELKFIQDPPDIVITPDRPSYSSGEIVSVHLSIVNGATPRNLKLSVFLQYPDGHLRSVGSRVKMPRNPPCHQWIHRAATHILSREFRIDWQWGLRLKNMPKGRYILYALMTEPGSGEVVSRSASIFYLTPINSEETLGEYGT